MNSHRMAAMAAALILCIASVQAEAVVHTGNFGDIANSALVGSDLGAASFVDINAVVNNVAVYTFTLSSAGLAEIESTSTAAGGAELYFTLFSGLGGAGTFVDSNYNQAFTTGGDFVYTANLAPGDYTLAVGVFANLSFAENLGTGTLADGFTAFGDQSWLGDGSYAVSITTPGIPEPATAALFAGGLLGMFAMRRFGRMRAPD